MKLHMEDQSWQKGREKMEKQANKTVRGSSKVFRNAK